jgi:peptidyl-tRNA hydrolase
MVQIIMLLKDDLILGVGKIMNADSHSHNYFKIKGSETRINQLMTNNWLCKGQNKHNRQIKPQQF